MWFGRGRREAERQLGAARRENQALSERRARAEAERDAARAELASVGAERDAARDAVAGLTAERDELRAVLGQSARSSTGTADGCWALLLADLARRWLAPVGAASAPSPSLGDGNVSDELAQAVTGELERLREEVGVDVEISVAGTIAPANPVVFLLAALGLVGALTTSCQRVVVKLEDQLELTGEDWDGQRDELDVARTRALAAGVVVSPVDVEDERVRVALTPEPDGSTPSPDAPAPPT